jgi:hypothetical protein
MFHVEHSAFHAFSKSIDFRASLGGVPSSGVPYLNPRLLMDSARSFEGAHQHAQMAAVHGRYG